MGDSGIGVRLMMPDGTQVVPLNSIFLDVKYANFRWDFPNVNIRDIYALNLMPILKQRLFIHITKVSNDDFELQLTRVNDTPENELEPGYFLELTITVVGHREGPKKKFMDFKKKQVLHVYKFSEMDFDRRGSGIWTIQCVIYMHEISFLRNRDVIAQNSLREILDGKESFSENIPDMEFLLGMRSLNDILSGRQDYNFAYFKKGYIRRTLKYAKEIAQKTKAEITNENFQITTSPDVYLGYIYNNALRPIHLPDVLCMYKDAYKYGLYYLIKECREFLLNNMTDLDFLVNILAHSVDVADFEVIPKAMTLFIKELDVLKSVAWNKLLRTEFPKARCIMHFAERRSTLDVNRIMARNGKTFEERVPRENLYFPLNVDKVEHAEEIKKSLEACTGTQNKEQSAAEAEEPSEMDSL